MKSPGCDNDGDSVDDLGQFQDDASHLENIQFLDPGIIDLAWDSDVDESDVKPAVYPHSDRKPETISEIAASSATVKPLVIQLVDCFKFPTYFDQHTQEMIERALEPHITTKIITPLDVNSNDRPTESGVQVSDLMEYKSLREGTKRLEAYKRRNDIEVKKAMSELNKTKVDLKKNKGLVGMKILQMPQGSLMKKNSIKQTKVNEDKTSHTILDPLNVEQIDKLLNKIGTSCTPVVYETPKGKNKILFSQYLVDATKAEINIDTTTSITTITNKQNPLTIKMVAKKNHDKQISNPIDNQEKYAILSEPVNVQAVEIHLGNKNKQLINKTSKPIPKSKKIEINSQTHGKDAQTSLQPIKYIPMLDETINKHLNTEHQKSLYENKAKDLTSSNVTSLGRPVKDSSALKSNKVKKTDLVNITSQIELKYPIVQNDSNIINKPYNKFTKNVLRIAKQKKKIKICAIDNSQTFSRSKPKLDNVSASCVKQHFEGNTEGSSNTCISTLEPQPCPSNEHHKERLTAIAENNTSIADSAVSENHAHNNKKVNESKAPRKQTITLMSDSKRNFKDEKFNENTAKLKIQIETNTDHNKVSPLGSPVDAKAQNQLIHTQNLSSPPHSRLNNMQNCQSPVKDNSLSVYNSMQSHTLYRPPPPNAQLGPRVSPNLTKNVQSLAPNKINHSVCNTMSGSSHVDRNSSPHIFSNRSLVNVGKKPVNTPQTPVIALTNLSRIHGEIISLDVVGSHDEKATHKTSEYINPEGFSIEPVRYPLLGSLPLEHLHTPSQMNGHSHSNIPSWLAKAQNSLPPLEVCKVGSGLVFWSPAFPPPNVPFSIPPPIITPLPPNTKYIHNTSIIDKNDDSVIRENNSMNSKIDQNNTDISKATDSSKQSKHRESCIQSFLKLNHPKRTDKGIKLTNSSLYPDPKRLTDAFERNSRLGKIIEKNISEPALDTSINMAVNDRDDGLIQVQNSKIEQKMVQLFGEDSNSHIGLQNADTVGNNKIKSLQKQNADTVNLKRSLGDVQKKPTMYKPGPLSKKKKLIHPDDVRILGQKSMNKGYSDPILPIPSYGEFLSMPYLYNFNDNVDTVDKTSEKIKGDTQTNSAKQLSLNKSKITKRRLTLDDYKKRTTTERRHFKEDKASKLKYAKDKANDIMRRTSNADSDLGYDSDNTVKL